MKDLKTIVDIASEERLILHLESSKPYVGYLHRDDSGKLFVSPEQKKAKKRPLIALSIERDTRLNGYRILGYDILQEKKAQERFHRSDTFCKPTSHGNRYGKKNILD